MNPDPQPSGHITTFTYTYDVADPLTALFEFEHDADKGIFRLNWPDGKVEVFRDKPVRHLVVQPDAETGEMKPVIKRGRPTYLYLCREEREVR